MASTTKSDYFEESLKPVILHNPMKDILQPTFIVDQVENIPSIKFPNDQFDFFSVDYMEHAIIC